MQLHSGLVIEKKACYFRKETVKRHSPETVGNHKEPHLLFTTFRKHLEYLEQFVGAFPIDMSVVRKDTRAFDGSSILECSFSLSTYSDQSLVLRMEVMRSVLKIWGKNKRKTRYYSVTMSYSYLQVKQVIVWLPQINGKPQSYKRQRFLAACQQQGPLCEATKMWKFVSRRDFLFSSYLTPALPMCFIWM